MSVLPFAGIFIFLASKHRSSWPLRPPMIFTCDLAPRWANASIPACMMFSAPRSMRPARATQGRGGRFQTRGNTVRKQATSRPCPARRSLGMIRCAAPLPRAELAMRAFALARGPVRVDFQKCPIGKKIALIARFARRRQTCRNLLHESPRSLNARSRYKAMPGEGGATRRRRSNRPGNSQVQGPARPEHSGKRPKGPP